MTTDEKLAKIAEASKLMRDPDVMARAAETFRVLNDAMRVLGETFAKAAPQMAECMKAFEACAEDDDPDDVLPEGWDDEPAETTPYTPEQREFARKFLSAAMEPDYEAIAELSKRLCLEREQRVLAAVNAQAINMPPIATPDRIEADRARFVAILSSRQPAADEPTIIEKQP